MEINHGKISLTADNIDLKEVLQAISDKTGMEVSYFSPEAKQASGSTSSSALADGARAWINLPSEAPRS